MESHHHLQPKSILAPTVPPIFSVAHLLTPTPFLLTSTQTQIRPVPVQAQPPMSITKTKTSSQSNFPQGLSLRTKSYSKLPNSLPIFSTILDSFINLLNSFPRLALLSYLTSSTQSSSISTPNYKPTPNSSNPNIMQFRQMVKFPKHPKRHSLQKQTNTINLQK